MCTTVAEINVRFSQAPATPEQRERWTALGRMIEARPEVVLLSGTGRPNLSLVPAEGRPLILSPSLCLAEAMITASADQPC
jgi:hypothetical protein